MGTTLNLQGLTMMLNFSMYKMTKQVSLNLFNTTPKESQMKTWLMRWQDKRSIEDNCMLYLMSVDETLRMSFFTSSIR